MILVTGSTGFLGKAVCNLLRERGIPYEQTSLSLGVDLRDPQATFRIFERVRPQYVLNCAAYVGGIQYGYKHPAELFSNNLAITGNLFEACRLAGVTRMVNPISNCVYPAQSTLFKEDEIWNGPLHESVMVYGFVRKASLVGAWAYARQYGIDVLNLIFSNMYGPGDHFEEERSHALGALIMKMVKAKRENRPFVEVWGTGKPVREWLHVNDGAEAMIRGLHAQATVEPINVGVAHGISIVEMAEMIKGYVGYEGEIHFDQRKPDGAPYKTVDGSRGEKLLGWSPRVPFVEGVRSTVDWYLNDKRGGNDARSGNQGR
jgi:GDP-L-fucose synthase